MIRDGSSCRYFDQSGVPLSAIFQVVNCLTLSKHAFSTRKMANIAALQSRIEHLGRTELEHMPMS